MLHLTYVGEQGKHAVDFEQIGEHVVQISGDVPVKGNGFTLSRIDNDDKWDYTDYRTVYKLIDGGVQFSNDGSVYVAPPEPEPVPDPEPYIPTLEEMQEVKLQEIGMECEQIIYAGVDVRLPGGTEHFSLTEKDQINLFGKQAQMAAGADRFEYHQDGHPCRYYTKEEMQMIVETALGFVTYHTTYCNALNMWVLSLKDVEAVNEVTYGCDIPKEYQNEVLQDILVKMREEDDETDI
ncbi:MAG: hypothetical protein OSJ72_12415 [Lachnospiraceae bacterium]|nr:hypothetical protein [Lachnospiraceae bacterium]